MRWSGWSMGLTIFGLVLVVFSLIWLLAIFPAMAKLPADHDEEIIFQGNYKIMNRQTQTLDQIPVNVERVQQATEVQDNVLLIKQTITTYTPAVGGNILREPLEEMLGVDRSTRAYVSGYGDMDRSGQFCFPAELKKESYSMWVLDARRPLEAEFIGEEEFQGLTVFRFKIEEHDLDMGIDPESGQPLAFDAVIDLWVEPVSGCTVDTESVTSIKVVPSPGMEIPSYISSISFTDDTVDKFVDRAASARSMLLWATVYGFWIAIGLGCALILGGVVMAFRTRPG